MAFTNTVLASTLQRREKGYLNAISSQIPLFNWLKGKGRYSPFKGGAQGLEWDVEYAHDTSEPSFAGYDVLPVVPQDNVEVASATMKNYFKAIAISGEEKRLNQGERIFDLLKQKETNALESMQQQMNDHFYLDGTGNGGKQITGLQAIIAAAPTSGTLFGLDRSTRTYWQNYQVDMSSGAAYDFSDSNPAIFQQMETLRKQCGRLKIGGTANRHPDLILCTENFHTYYETALRLTGQRFVNSTDVGDPAFGKLKFHGAAIDYDEDMPADAGSDEQAYFINSRFMTLNYHPDANFKMSDLSLHDEQDAFSSRLIWMGELTCSMPRKQGLLHGVGAPAT